MLGPDKKEKKRKRYKEKERELETQEEPNSVTFPAISTTLQQRTSALLPTKREPVILEDIPGNFTVHPTTPRREEFSLKEIPLPPAQKIKSSLPRSRLLEALKSKANAEPSEKDPIALEDLPTTIPSAPPQPPRQHTKLMGALNYPNTDKKSDPTTPQLLKDLSQSTRDTSNTEKDPISLENLSTKQPSRKPTRLMEALNYTTEDPNANKKHSPRTPPSDPNSTSSNSSVGTGPSSDPSSAESVRKSKKQLDIEKALPTEMEMELLEKKYELIGLLETEEEKARTALEKEQEKAIKDIDLHWRQLKLLHEEEQNREKLKKEEQELYNKFPVDELVQLETIKRKALTKELQNGLQGLSEFQDQLQKLQPTQLKTAEQLRQQAVEATTQENREQIAKQWAKVVDQEVLSHVIKNLDNANKTQEKEQLLDFIKLHQNDPHTALQIAIRDNNTDIVNIILSNITDDDMRIRYVNQHCVCGKETTALHFAALLLRSTDSFGMIKSLVETHKANITALNYLGETPLMWCFALLVNEHTELKNATTAEQLLQYHENITNIKKTIIFLITELAKKTITDNLTLLTKNYLKTLMSPLRDKTDQHSELLFNELMEIYKKFNKSQSREPKKTTHIPAPKKKWR